jgi:hypothetical protein
MDPDLVIPALEREWAQPDGFFGRLRMGVFDSDGFERVVRLIKSIHIDDRLVIDRSVFLGMVQEAGGPTCQSVELGLHEKPPEGYGGFARIGHTSRGCSYESVLSLHA